MSPVEKEIVRKKLSVIIECLRALEPIKGLDVDEYVKDIYKRKATERLLQELIEAAIDINAHVMVEGGRAAPDDYFQSFTGLGEMGVLPSELATELAGTGWSTSTTPSTTP